MRISIDELAQARKNVGSLLEELGLEAYVFEVEPHDDGWELRVECATDTGWQALRLPVERRLLLASSQDVEVREQLRQDWRQRLEACKRHR